MENSCSERLYDWIKENGLLDDPDRLSKIGDEAWRRWGHEISSVRISQIVRATLKMIK